MLYCLRGDIVLELQKTTINIGLKEPVKILHITDVHICEVSELDEPWQQELMKERTEGFEREGNFPKQTPEEFFKEAVALAKEVNATLVCTGDVFDIHTKGNLAKFKKLIVGEDMMYSPGGHEYQKQIVRTLEEPDGYGAKMEEKLREELSEFNIEFECRTIGGVNIITANNSLDYYSEYTVEKFEQTLKNGLPTIVFSHDPLDDKLLNCREPYHENVKITKGEYEVSHRMLSALKTNPQVVTTFTGHHHTSREYVIADKTHYVKAGLFKGICRPIEII